MIRSWFQTFAVFWMLCSFLWVIPRRLNFMCRRIGTLFHLHRWCKLTPPMNTELTECSETSAHKIQTPGRHPEERIHDHVSYTPRTCNFGLKNGWNTLPCEWVQKSPSKRQLPATLRGAGVQKFQFFYEWQLFMESSGLRHAFRQFILMRPDHRSFSSHKFCPVHCRRIF